MPNAFAYLVLFSWPLVTVFLFRRLPPHKAVIWTILGGYLLLPPRTQLDLPVIPDLEKFGIANICAYVGFLATRQIKPGRPRSALYHIFLALIFLTPFGTVLTNLDYIPFHVGGLPPMLLVEIPGKILTGFVTVMPILIGYQVFRDEESMRDLLVALLIAGLAYSVPMLIEVRLSPQINVWVYGFFQHSFDQMMRYGGFRPIVFLPHGLWVAFFAFMATFSAMALLRHEPDNRPKYFFLCLYLMIVLVLCKSANAVTYIVLFGPILLFLSPRMQARIAGVLAAIVLFYPVLRGSGLVPTTAIADFALSLDPNRAQSFVFRLTNEDILLERAGLRPWFGWGGWGRSLVHDEMTGLLASVIDGQWIVTLGINGWFGYIAEMGLLTLPLMLLAVHGRRHSPDSYRYAAAVALILAANLVDLIPNATLIPFTWLLAGALLGRVEAMKAAPVSAASAGVATPAVVTTNPAAVSPAPWARRQPQG